MIWTVFNNLNSAGLHLYLHPGLPSLAVSGIADRKQVSLRASEQERGREREVGKSRKEKDERMKGVWECSYPWKPHSNSPASFLTHLQWDSVSRSFSHTSPHPNARPHVFLIHYLKERNAARTKINRALLDQTMCRSDSSSNEAVVLTGGGWTLQSVCHPALCLCHTVHHDVHSARDPIVWAKPDLRYFKKWEVKQSRVK